MCHVEWTAWRDKLKLYAGVFSLGPALAAAAGAARAAEKDFAFCTAPSGGRPGPMDVLVVGGSSTSVRSAGVVAGSVAPVDKTAAVQL